jgi:tetratricopeptide (TPR) repeat protein
LGRNSKTRQPANPARREFLSRSCLWASAGLIASPLRGFGFARSFRPQQNLPPHELDDRLTPHYLQPAPIDAVLKQVEPGLDEFITEKYAEQIKLVLEEWSTGLTQTPPAFDAFENSISQTLRASSPIPSQRLPMRPRAGLGVFRNQFPDTLDLNGPQFVGEFRKFVAAFSSVATAEFKMVGISTTGNPSQPVAIQTHIRYDLVGTGADFHRGERVGHWDLEWKSDSAGGWRVTKWQALEETESRASGPMFVDVTGRALGALSSYQQQLNYGADHWRTVLDAASRIDVYGNNGIAVGDMDGDGFEDVYVCQPSGLPNRLYRNRGDGTFEDVTEHAGVDVLDSTACALFADVKNSGRQDLIVVCVDGPLLFLNDGRGNFQLKPDAFKFTQTPQGTFTGAALADYDGDGYLDIYFGLYSYYLGLNQYQYPTPYYDAENGPPNFLMHNQGDGTFADVTATAGINVNNNRYTFTCGWVDFDRDGRPDLYVVNDFGKKNLFRNNGNGTFTDVAREAGVEDVGAGMSVCWFDYDNDGRQDLYVADMWSAAGVRVSTQDQFMEGAPEDVRALLRKHAEGNSLFRNEGNGHFADTGAQAGVRMGRWSWSSYAWDFDHDGYEDLYIANGMISGPDRRELSSFFWRQTVAETPVRLEPGSQPVPSTKYQLGWNAINELIRSDGTWAGYQRNNFYANNRDGTFSEVAGAIGLDCIEDSRTFALADFDHDGRLEVFLKNRSGPQLRILHNAMEDLGASIAFRLRGHKSNRDSIGAEVALESGGLRQVKVVRTGGGFLCQHTKELYFGLGSAGEAAKATVRWPSGLVQHFENLPVGNLIRIEEGIPEFRAEPFVAGSGGGQPAFEEQRAARTAAPPVETWLLAPVAAPDFSLNDVAGHQRKLTDFRGRPLLLNFWRTSSKQSMQDLALFGQAHARWAAKGLQLATINLNPAEEGGEVRKLAEEKRYTFPILLATEETAAVYNILYHYLFDRRRNLGIPTSFLVDAMGQIVKVYQGPVKGESIEADFLHIPQTAAERSAKGLPFPGRLYGAEFRRNQFTYALVFMQSGYVDQALSSCRLVLEREPENAEAHYLLGMIYLKKKMTAEARASFLRTVHLTPSQPSTWPDAWNNLGMLAAQEGRSEEAIENLKEAIKLNPGYTVALENLGNVYRQQHRWAEAQATLERALETDSNDADVNYSLAMTYAQQGDPQTAEKYFDAAIILRPDYPEALNNLGVLYLTTRRVEEGVKSFETCVRVAPDFDQAYINLAKVYAQRGERDRAADILRQLLQRHPDHALAKRMLEELAQ